MFHNPDVIIEDICDINNKKTTHGWYVFLYVYIL